MYTHSLLRLQGSPCEVILPCNFPVRDCSVGSKEMTQLQKKVKNRRKKKKKKLRGVFYKIPETTETKIFVF